jgi:hypothetical protein
VTETTAEDNAWYLARDGKQHGPLSNVEMTKLVELGHLRATDLIWRPGFSDWRPAPTVFELSPPAPTPPKPAPQTPAVAPKPEPAPAASVAAPSPVLTAPRPQPSFANLSSKPEAAAPAGTPAPQRFEFPRTQPAAASGPSAGSSAPAPSVSQPKPMAFDSGAFKPLGTSSQFGAPVPAQELAPEPFHMDPMFEDAEPPRKSRGIGTALGLLVVIGGLSAAGYTYRDTIKAALQGQGAAPVAELPVVAAPAPETSQTSATTAASPSSPSPEPSQVVAAAEPQPAPAAPLPGVAVTGQPDVVDSALQSSPFWSYAKSEFPQWYADRLRDVGDLKAANQPDTAIDRKLVEAIVVMRRQNASNALSASPAHLKDIAETFVANLSALQSQSVDACYEFIEKGEMTPAAAALVQKPAEGAPLHAQLRAVFTAVVDGQKSPVTRSAPQPADYNLLAAELGTIGWSQADIQLFADPKALAAAPRDRVCKMVKEWFQAHLAVKDEPARERLLHETLRLVIAG